MRFIFCRERANDQEATLYSTNSCSVVIFSRELGTMLGKAAYILNLAQYVLPSALCNDFFFFLECLSKKSLLNLISCYCLFPPYLIIFVPIVFVFLSSLL